jgi:hypothetical protein
MLKKLFAGLLGAGFSLTSWAGIVATWNFNNYLVNGQTMVNASSWDSASVNGDVTPSLTATAPTGGSLNSVSGNPGNAIQFNAGGIINGNNGTFTFTLTAVVNINEFELSYDINEGFFPGPDTQWSWAIAEGGSGFSTIPHEGSSFINNWVSHTVDFAGSSLSAGQTITFTMQLVNENSGLGNDVSFDNLIVSAVPEPVNVALLIFGVGLAAVPAGRRLYLWARV